MIRHFAFAFILVQVATASALATQVFLFTAANAHDDMAVSQVRLTDKACEPTTRPDIPENCPQRVKPKELTFVLSADR
jgi:hypothetical protein